MVGGRRVKGMRIGLEWSEKQERRKGEGEVSYEHGDLFQNSKMVHVDIEKAAFNLRGDDEE